MQAEISLQLLDLGMNAVEAGARLIRLLVAELPRRGELCLLLADDGPGLPAGMDPADPVSSKPGRRGGVGLGLAFFQQLAAATGGRCWVRSAPGRGTTLAARLPAEHWDLPPLGDLPGTVWTLLRARPGLDLAYRRRRGRHRFRFDTRELGSEWMDEVRRNPLLARAVLEYLQAAERRLGDEAPGAPGRGRG